MMSSLFVIITCVIAQTHSSWVHSVVKLPSASANMLMGYNTNTTTVYIFGGDGDGLGKEIWKWNMYDGTLHFITVNTKLPGGSTVFSSSNQESVTIGNYVYLFNSNYNPGPDEKDFYIFDMNTETFANMSIPNAPIRGCQYSCIVTNISHIFIIGGVGYEWFCSVMQIFDINSNKWTTTYLPPGEVSDVEYSFCTSTSDSLYLIGNDAQGNVVQGLTYKYEYNNDKWYWIDNEPVLNSWGWAVYSNKTNHIYTVGGIDFNGGADSNVVNIFDVNTQKYIGTDAMLDAVQGAPALMIGDQIMVFGGITDGGDEYLSSIQIGTIPLVDLNE